jgi:ABC-type uncharacterized transport system permease subunit
MFAGISTFCFAASYAVALALELSRFFSRSTARRVLLLIFSVAGLLAHTLFLVHRATTQTGTPLSSEQDWYLVAAWVLAALYIYLTFYHARTAFGLFLLPLVLALIGVAHFVAATEPFPVGRTSQRWGMVHGVFLLVGTVTVIVGFMAGVMYLIQASRLKHKLPPSQSFQLPTLERLERTNERAIIVSTIMLTLGVLSGIILNLVNRRHPDELPWTDPVVWSSGLLWAWLAVSTVFNMVYRPARQGRKVAYLTVANFVFLVLALCVWLFVPSKHGTRDRGQEIRDRVQTVIKGSATIGFSSSRSEQRHTEHACYFGGQT